MSNIEHVNNESILDRIKDIEKAGTLHIKGYTYSEISSFLSITATEAKSYIEEYKKIIQRQADKDPYFLERIQFNTVKALQEFDQISKEAWETVSIATDHGMVAQRIQALKLASDIATKKAQLHKLMSGGNQADAEYIQRMQKAESVNGILSRVLRDVISNHPQIAEEVRKELEIAFEIMQGGSEEDPEEIIDYDDSPPAPNI
jgi:hypothetical protein